MKKIWCLLCFVRFLCSETAWVRNNAAPILGQHTVQHLQRSGFEVAVWKRAEATETVQHNRLSKESALAALRERVRKTEEEAAAAEAFAVAAASREAAEAAAVEAATAAENAAAEAAYRKLQQKKEELHKPSHYKFHSMLASSMNFESRYLQLFLGAIIPSVALLMLSNYIIASDKHRKGDRSLGAVSLTLIGDLTSRPWNVYLDEYGDVEADILASMQMQERLNDDIEVTEEDGQKLSMETNDESPVGLTQEPEELDWAKVVGKVVVFVALFLILTIWLEHFCDKEVTAASEHLMRFLGLPGLFLAVLLADGLPQPFTYVPLIFMAVKGNVSKLAVFIVCAAASYSAAWVGYVVGWNVSSFQWAQVLMERLTLKYPMVPQLMERKGALGVASAALLPVPLAVATWTAGSFRVGLFPFALAALMRLPKIAVFVLLSRRN